MSRDASGATLLGNQRQATQYRILIEIAHRQPAINQQEIAAEIGITSQAVSNYLTDLIDQGHVESRGRGRYELTHEGVDWLLSRTEDLRSLLDYVSEEVVGDVAVDAAVAAATISSGERVCLSMADGCLTAWPAGSTDEGAMATAATSATTGDDVAVTDFDGVLDYDQGEVRIVAVPPVREGGSGELAGISIEDLAAKTDLVAVDGVEALVGARAAGLSPDVRFGTVEAVVEATQKGLDVLVLVVADRLSKHVEKLTEQAVSYTVIDPERGDSTAV